LDIIIKRKKEKYMKQIGTNNFCEIYDVFSGQLGVLDMGNKDLDIKEIENFIMARNGQNLVEACDLAFNIQMLLAQEMQLNEIKSTIIILEGQNSHRNMMSEYKEDI